MTDGGLPHSDMHGSLDACSYPCLFAAYRVLHRLLAPRHPPYALVHLTYLRSCAFVFANVICLNPKMLGSIHFKLIREANSFNEVRTFVLTIVSVNDKSPCVQDTLRRFPIFLQKFSLKANRLLVSCFNGA